MKENKQQPRNNQMEELEGKLGPLKGRVKGKKPIKLLGICTLIIAGGYGIYRLVSYFANKGDSKTSQEEHTHNTNDRISLDDAKSRNTINEHHEASNDIMAVDDNRTDNDIRKAQAFSEIRLNERKQMMELRQTVTPVALQPAQKEQSLKGWIDSFRTKYPMPDYSSIPFLASVLDGCPDQYKDAMMLSFLTECGALCFSKVRARYLDGQKHSPSLQTIVEGVHGSGKGKFLQMHKTFFERITKIDAARMPYQKSGLYIIQTAGINISQSMFYNVVARNQDVHIYAIETETSIVERVFKKPNGLGFDYLRLAFHNEPIYQNNNKVKGGACGPFKVFFNYTFTGTPKSISSLIDEEEVEDGTASRICFTLIPEGGRKIPSVKFPEGDELEAMKDQIDTWREQYCFKPDYEGDQACPETVINLDYICNALQEWLDEQYDMGMEEGNDVRKGDRARMATIAFHAAIILHMLAGNPQPKDIKLRRTVKDLTIYIAIYCMERYLSKFSDFGLKVQANETNTGDSTPATSAPEHRRLTQEELDEWYCVRGTLDENGKVIGLGTIGKKLGVDKFSVYNSFNSYERKMGLK